MEIKLCKSCGEEKNVCEFYKNKYSSDGLRSNCKMCQNKNSTNWRISNPEKYKEKQERFLTKNPGISYEYSKKWKEKNKEYIRAYSSKKMRERYNEDPLYKIQINYRNRLKDIFRIKGLSKNKGSIDYLGCDLNSFKEHIEKQFSDGMSWDNKGFYGWHIDHIIPLSSAKTREDLIKLFHYTNLQPLWWKDNFTKGSKII